MEELITNYDKKALEKYKEFNLSKKRIDKLDGYIYREKDVKEFIKRLKESFYAQDFTTDEAYEYSMNRIDKLAGEKLNDN